MKIALYIEDGREQIVLTPQSKVEKDLLGKLDGSRDFSVRKGSFYATRGGWTRHGSDDESTMIVLDTPARTSPDD